MCYNSAQKRGPEKGPTEDAIPKLNKLTARQVETAGIGKHGDGGGLFLRVRKNGSKAWVYVYRFRGRVREMGLGPYPKITLKKAREEAQTRREQLADGEDPIFARRAARRDDVPIFREAAELYIEAHEAGWRNSKHTAQWRTTIETYANPVVGRMWLDQIGTAEVLKILEPIWTTKNETARRLRGRIEKILSWGKVRGYCAGDNPAAWKGNLEAELSHERTITHLKSLPWAEIPAFMAALKKREGMAASAVEFVVLTAARSGEVRGTTWDEIDLNARTWTVPASRMKRNKAHMVPLSEQAMHLLVSLPRFADTDVVFPSPRGGKPLSDMSLSMVARRMNADTTVHGFRSSFRTWASESTTYANDVAEYALAHRTPDATEAAYKRTTLFDKRVQLMGEWGKYCASPPKAKGDVVPIASKVKSR